MSLPETLHPTHREKTLSTMKAMRAVKCITFNPSEANPSETLYIQVPRVNENKVLVPGSLVLRFGIDLSGRHTNNFLLQNILRHLWTSWS